MSSLPEISILIPAFNAESVLAETLESVRAQTFQNFEVIIIDDGSTDGTAAIGKSFSDADARFRVLRRLHEGLPATRNAGIAQAHARWIAFLDADDIWLPEKLERQRQVIYARPDVDFVFSGFSLWDGQRDIRARTCEESLLSDGKMLERLIQRNRFGISTVIVRADLMSKAGPFDPMLHRSEDWDMWLRMAECGMTVAGVPEPLVRYRRWQGNMTKHRRLMIEGQIATLEKNLRQTRHPELAPAYERALARRRAKHELARACTSLQSTPETAAAMVWRAWQHQPTELKWLLWSMFLSLPTVLGGSATKGFAKRKLIRRYGEMSTA